jgi:hypothetical protein
MTALKSALYLILVAGLGAGYIPFAQLPAAPQVETGMLAYLAFPLWLIGAVMVLWCFAEFTFKGHGTPNPINPPKELVTTGGVSPCSQPHLRGDTDHNHRSLFLVQNNLDARICAGGLLDVSFVCYLV